MKDTVNQNIYAFFLQSYLNCYLKFHTLIMKLYCALFGTVCYLSEMIPSQTNSQV